MEKYKVHLTLPKAKLGNSDATFSIYHNNEKLGSIIISKSYIEWYSSETKIYYTMDWIDFDEMIKNLNKK